MKKVLPLALLAIIALLALYEITQISPTSEDKTITPNDSRPLISF